MMVAPAVSVAMNVATTCFKPTPTPKFRGVAGVVGVHVEMDVGRAAYNAQDMVFTDGDGSQITDLGDPASTAVAGGLQATVSIAV
jgi:hypothetical protein